MAIYVIKNLAVNVFSYIYMSISGWYPWSFFFSPSHFVILGYPFLLALFCTLIVCTGVLPPTPKTMNPAVIPMLEYVFVFFCRIYLSFQFDFEGGDLGIG